MRKIIALGIMLLFLGMTISSSTGPYLEKQSTIASFDGNTLYVGGSGPGNYSKIQDAIDDSSNGDTVYVFDYSSPYFENVVIDKSINLIGEDRNTTVIDGSGNIEDVVYVSSDWVAISGLTITNGGIRGIVLVSNYNTITDNNIISNIVYGMVILYSSSNDITGNNISNNQAGLSILDSSSNIITGNIILNSWGSGIILEDSRNNNIIDNVIQSNGWCGIGLYKSNNTSIIHNKISDNGMDVALAYSNNNIILGNNIISNDYNSISLSDSSNNNIIYHNNFMSSTSWVIDGCNNSWDNGYPSCGNYWYVYNGTDGDGIGDTPKPIYGGDNEDRYPLMEPYGITKLSFVPVFRFLGSIKNIGNHTAFNVQWKTTIDGGFILLGRESSGTLPKPLLPGEEITVKSKLIFGFGRITITVELWADNVPYRSVSFSAMLFFFFIKLIKGGII